MYLVIQERFKYPVSRKPLIGPQLTTAQPVSSITHKNQERII